jgi:osmotically-inducible protein OsmY
MPSNSPTSPSYDEITRRTVPELDSSMRPTKEQEVQAREGFRAMDDGEKVLYARVSDALLTSGASMGKIKIEIDRGTVRLMGNVQDAATIDRATELVQGVSGVAGVDNQLVVLANG